MCAVCLSAVSVIIEFYTMSSFVFIQSSRTQVVHSHWDIYIVESLFRSERREVQAFYLLYNLWLCAHV